MAQIVIDVTDAGSLDGILGKLRSVGVEGAKVERGAAGMGGAFVGMGKTGIPAIDSINSRLKGMGPAAIGAAAAIAGITAGIVALKMAVDLGARAVARGQEAWAPYEQGLRNVGAVSGATRAEIAELSVEALRLASATRFSPSEVTEALYALASAGQKTKEQIASLPAVLNFAEAAQADLALSTELVTSTLANFALEASQSNRVVDVYTAAIGSSALNAERLKLAMSQAGPAGASLGQSLEGTTASVAILTTALGSGEKAGTGYRAILSQLILKQDELGIKATDAAGNMRPLADIIADLEKRSIPATEIITILGQEAGPVLSILVGKGSEALREMEARLESTGQAARVAGDQLDTLQGDLDILASKEEEFWVLLGQSTGEGSRIITQAQTEFWQALVDLVNDNNEVIGESFTTLASIIGTGLQVAADVAEPTFDAIRASAIVAGEQIETLTGFIEGLAEVTDKALGPLDEMVASLVRLVGLGEPETLLKLIQTLAPLGGVFGLVAAHAATTGAEVGKLTNEFEANREAAKVAAEAAAKLDQEYSDLSALDLGDAESAAKILRVLDELAAARAAEEEAAAAAAAAQKKAQEDLKEAYKDRIAEQLRSSQELREAMEAEVELLQLQVSLTRALQEMGGFQDLSTIDRSGIPLPEPDIGVGLPPHIQAERREAERVAAEFESLLARAFDDMSTGDLVSSFANLGRAIGVKMGEGLSEELQEQWADALTGLGALVGNVFDSAVNDAEVSAADWLSAFGSIWGPVGAAIGGFVGSYIDSRAQGAVVGQAEFQVGGTQYDINALSGSVDAINEAFERVEQLVSGTIESTEKIAIKVKANGTVWLTIGNVLSTTVDSVEEALDLATTYLLRTAEFAGVPEQVLQALANTSASTVEQLMSDLAFAMEVARLDMGPVRAFFMDFFDQMSREIERAIELGIDPSPLITRAGETLLEALKDAASPEEYEELANAIREERARLEAAIAAAQAELEIVQERILRMMDRTSRMPESVLVAAMKQAADLAALLATLEGQLGALPLEIPPFQGRGGGGRSRREAEEREREGVREAVEGLERDALDPFRQSLAAYGDILPDLIARLDAAKFSQAEYAELLERAAVAAEAAGEALVEGVIAEIDALAPAGLPLTEALAGIGEQAALTADKLLALYEAGLLTAEAYQELTERLEANAAAARQAQAEAQAENVLLQALQFLGRGEEAARLQFELQRAELLLKIRELEVAQQIYGIQIEGMAALSALAADIADAEFVPPTVGGLSQPTLRNVESAAERAARELEELAERTARANEGLRALVDDLSLGEIGAAVSPEQALANARQRYEQTLAAARGGSIEAREALDDVARDYLAVLERTSPAALGVISPQILAALQGLLGIGPAASTGGSLTAGAPPAGNVIGGAGRFLANGRPLEDTLGRGVADLVLVSHQQLVGGGRQLSELQGVRAELEGLRADLGRVINLRSGDQGRGTAASVR